MEYVVYGIVDASKNEVFYVGYSRNVKKRMRVFSEGDGGWVGERVREIVASGSFVTWVALQKTTTEAAAKKTKAKWREALSEGVASQERVSETFAKKGSELGQERREDEIIALGIEGKFKELEEKFGMNEEEYLQWIKKYVSRNEYDEIDGF